MVLDGVRVDLVLDFLFHVNYQKCWKYNGRCIQLLATAMDETIFCGHYSKCSCGGEDYCGIYTSGQKVKYWDSGCPGTPRQLECYIRIL